MADKIELDVVTPERRVLSREVDAVVLPGELGYLGVLPGHAPLLTRLSVGELGFDADFRLAWNVDADTQAEDGSRIRFEASYSDPSKLSDLDLALTLVEDDGNGYIPNLEYYLLAKLTDLMGQGSDWNAPYASTMGLELDAFVDYRIFLNEDETMWIEPHAGAGYDFGVLQQPEDSVFKANIYLLGSFFPNTEMKLMYDTPQLLKSQEGYVITFDENYSPTATLTDMTAQDVGEITLEVKVLY